MRCERLASISFDAICCSSSILHPQRRGSGTPRPAGAAWRWKHCAGRRGARGARCGQSPAGGAGGRGRGPHACLSRWRASDLESVRMLWSWCHLAVALSLTVAREFDSAVAYASAILAALATLAPTVCGIFERCAGGSGKLPHRNPPRASGARTACAGRAASVSRACARGRPSGLVPLTCSGVRACAAVPSRSPSVGAGRDTLLQRNSESCLAAQKYAVFCEILSKSEDSSLENTMGTHPSHNGAGQGSKSFAVQRPRAAAAPGGRAGNARPGPARDALTLPCGRRS